MLSKAASKYRTGFRTSANLRRGGCAAALFALCLLCLSSPAFAHGDTSERITDLTYSIALDPSDATLFVERGKLLQLNGHHKEALSDFEQAAVRNEAPGETDFLRGLALLALDRPAKGKPHLDRFLAVHPDDTQALAARARTLAALGDGRGAAADFTRVIARAPVPDYYAERAHALAAAGQVGEAVRGLDEAHKRLGTLVSLQRLAIDLELARNNIDGAVARVDSMAEITGRGDIWLARRGDILLQAGRHDDARAAYGQALAAIETLSLRRQRSKTVRDLKNRLQALLRQRAAADSPTTQ